MSTFNQDDFLSEHERKQKGWQNYFNSVDFGDKLPVQDEILDLLNKSLTPEEVRDLTEPKKVEEDQPDLSKWEGFEDEDLVLMDINGEGTGFSKSIELTEGDLQTIDQETWRDVLEKGRQIALDIIDGVPEEESMVYTDPSGKEHKIPFKHKTSARTGYKSAYSRITDRINPARRLAAEEEAKSLFDITSIPVVNYLGSLVKGLEGSIDQALSDGFRMEIVKNVGILEEPSNTLDENLEMKALAIKNIYTLTELAKLFNRHEDLADIFPGLDWKNPDTALSTLEIQLEGALEELKDNYKEMLDPEYEWKQYLVESSQRFIDPSITDKDSLFDFIEEVALDTSFTKYSPQQVQNYLTHFEIIIKAKEDFVTQVSGSKEQLGLLQKQRSLLDEIRYSGRTFSDVSLNESTSGILFSRDATTTRYLYQGDGAANQRYENALEDLYRHYLPEYNTLVSSIPGYKHSPEGDATAIDSLNSVFTYDRSGQFITGINYKNLIDNPTAHLALVNTLISLEKEAKITGGDPVTKHLVDQLTDNMILRSELSIDDPEKAREFFTSSWILKEIFRGKNGLEDLKDITGLTSKQVTVLREYSRLISEIFTADDGSLLTATGKFTSALANPDTLARYIQGMAGDQGLINKVADLIAIITDPSRTINLSGTIGLFGYDSDDELFGLHLGNLSGNGGVVDADWKHWSNNLERQFSEYNIGFPEKGSVKDNTFIEDLINANIFSEEDIKTMRNKDYKIPYLMLLQTYMRTDKSGSEISMSVIMNAIKQTKKGSGFGIISLIHTVDPGYPFYMTKDGQIIKQTTLDNGETPIGIAPKILRESTGIEGTGYTSVAQLEVDNWSKYGVNAGRDKGAVSEEFYQTRNIFRDPLLSAGLLVPDPGMEKIQAKVGWNKYQIDRTTMYDTAKENFSFTRFAAYANKLKIDSGEWDKRVADALQKVFDPIDSLAKEAILTGTDSFGYNNIDAHVGVLYEIMKQAEADKLNNGDISFFGMLPDELEPTPEGYVRRFSNAKLTVGENADNDTILLLNNQPINWQIGEWEQVTKNFTVDWESPFEMQTEREAFLSPLALRWSTSLNAMRMALDGAKAISDLLPGPIEVSPDVLEKTTPEAIADTKESRIAPKVAEITTEELEKKERAETATYISGYEGYIETPRTLPNEKHKTVGIGHLLDGSKRSRAAFKKAFPNKNYNTYMKGKGKLTKEEAQKLFQEDLPDYIKTAKKLTGDKFDTYSHNLRKNIISATYRGSWGQSPTARKLLAEGKFEEAATEFLNNDEYRNAVKLKRAGIRPRMEAVAKAIRDEATKETTKEAAEEKETTKKDDPIPHILPTAWEQARGAAAAAGTGFFLLRGLSRWTARRDLANDLANETTKKLVASINKKFKAGLHTYTDEESKWLLDNMKRFYKKQSKKSLKSLNKAATKPLIKSTGKLLSKVAGKILPGGTIAMLIFGGASDAGDIAEKLTQDQMDVLEKVRRNVEEYGISQTEALIYHQLGAFARSPGTKF